MDKKAPANCRGASRDIAGFGHVIIVQAMQRGLRVIQPFQTNLGLRIEIQVSPQSCSSLIFRSFEPGFWLYLAALALRNQPRSLAGFQHTQHSELLSTLAGVFWHSEARCGLYFDAYIRPSCHSFGRWPRVIARCAGCWSFFGLRWPASFRRRTVTFL